MIELYNIVDLSVKKGNDKIFYEFKSVKEFLANFTQQFTNDLKSAKKLSNIKWVFEKRGNINMDYLKTEALKVFKSQKGKNAIEMIDEKQLMHLFNTDDTDFIIKIFEKKYLKKNI